MYIYQYLSQAPIHITGFLKMNFINVMKLLHEKCYVAIFNILLQALAKCQDTELFLQNSSSKSEITHHRTGRPGG
jgi:hypothetical protein